MIKVERKPRESPQAAVGTLTDATFPFTELPEGMQAYVVAQLPDSDQASLSLTCKRYKRFVDEQPYVRDLLQGGSPNLPPHPHAKLQSLVKPYGGLQATRARIEQIHRRGECLDDISLCRDDGLFTALLDRWAEKEEQGGSSHEQTARAKNVLQQSRRGERQSLLLATRTKTLPPLNGLASVRNLDIVRCLHLVALPDRLGDRALLKNLTLYACESLASLPACLGDLKGLTNLQVDGCTRLNSLPESLGGLQSLTRLDIFNCPFLGSLPNQLGDLIALNILDVDHCLSLASLPQTLGGLRALNWLSLRTCPKLVLIPETIGDLRALKTLDLYNNTSLTALPKHISDLCTLEHLNLADCPNLSREQIEAVRAALPACALGLKETQPHGTIASLT